MKHIIKSILFITLICILHTSVCAQSRRSMWVWNSAGVVGNTSQENILLNECIATSVTDLYLYTGGSVLSNPGNVRSFISRASCLNIKVWGMDGWRGYFSDLCGPSEFYGNIQDIIDYNTGSAANEKFTGFHGDNEFHVNDGSTGCGPGNVFHLGSTDAALSTTSGGLWQASARADRDSLMSDFVKQTATATAKCHAAGLEYGIAVMPWISGVSWTNAAMGQQNTPLMAKYNGVTKELYKHLMDYVDEYVVMSYHTNVTGKVALMCKDVLDYGDVMPAGTCPRILSGLETYCDVGEFVSYCDTPGEDNKTHVRNEMTLHGTTLGGTTHPSYSGQALHDWSGWSGLVAVSNNTATPTCAVTAVTKQLAVSSYLQYDAFSRHAILNTSGSGNFDFQISNIGGVSVYRSNMTIQNSTAEFTLPVLSPGIYVYHVSFEDGTTGNGKIIVIN